MLLKKFFNKSIVYFLLFIISVFFIFPILWLFLTSFKNPIEATNPWSLPSSIRISNYVAAFNTGNFSNAFINTIIIGLFSVGLSLILGFPIAYAISRFRNKFNNCLISTFLTLRILPEMLFLLPLYVIFRYSGLFDTYLGMTLTFQILLLPLTVLLLKNFINEIPKEIEESAKIDGASDLLIILKIVVPLTLPGIVVVSIFGFILVWTNLLFPLALSYSNASTVSVAIAGFKGYGSFNWPIMCAAALIITIPQVILFAFISKYLVEGLASGSIK